VNEDGPWTLDELAARVAAELAVDYPGAPSGRVRDVPDRRAIRWYTTIGLVDRPLGMRGRTALYGPRHVLQLVAVKRRQAAGRTLAEIQAELAGATDRTLRAIADPPTDGDELDGAQSAGDGPGGTGLIGDEADSDEADEWGRDESVAAGRADGAAGPARARFWATQAAAVAAPAPALPPAPVGTGELAVAGRAVVLAGGVTVVLPGVGREVTGADLGAIGAAAGPLVEVLVRRGLVLVEDDGERSGGS
jgi:DNA-binding transcriptional MerR regulator